MWENSVHTLEKPNPIIILFYLVVAVDFTSGICVQYDVLCAPSELSFYHNIAPYPYIRASEDFPHSCSAVSSSSSPSPSQPPSLLVLPSTKSICSFASENCAKSPSFMTHLATARSPFSVDKISWYRFVPASSYSF